MGPDTFFVSLENVSGPFVLGETTEVAIMMFTLEIEREEDGRWIAEIPELPGVMKYGDTREVAIAQTEALALRVLAERIEHGEHPLEPIHITFAAA